MSKGTLQQAYDQLLLDKLNLEGEVDKCKDFLRRIKVWTEAYPLKVFPKPDLKKAAKVLKENGMTLDAISADNMRHVLNGLKEIANEALEDKDNE